MPLLYVGGRASRRAAGPTGFGRRRRANGTSAVKKQLVAQVTPRWCRPCERAAAGLWSRHAALSRPFASSSRHWIRVLDQSPPDETSALRTRRAVWRGCATTEERASRGLCRHGGVLRKSPSLVGRGRFVKVDPAEGIRFVAALMQCNSRGTPCNHECHPLTNSATSRSSTQDGPYVSRAMRKATCCSTR
jgi:hypothetical protein